MTELDSVIQQGDWYNIPNIIIETLSQYSKKIAQFEIRLAQQEEEIRYLKKQAAESVTLKAQLQELQHSQTKLARTSDLDNLKHELVMKTTEPTREYLEEVKSYLQRQLNPDFFRPAIQAELRTIQKQITAEFTSINQVIQDKPSFAQVNAVLTEKLTEFQQQNQNLTLKLQQILKNKADLTKVNEILITKADAVQVKNALQQFITKGEIREINAETSTSQQIQAQKQVMELQIMNQCLQSKVNEVQLLLNAGNKQLLQKINEIQLKTQANTVQIATTESVAQQSIQVAKSLKNNQNNEFKAIMEPIIEGLNHLRKQIRILETEVDRKADRQ
ncbi:Conserved_hypothetical protein [Hexamita inflata]|uniref:Uncharacterized protein n=1 Tax=Hexamita inflata TaxID=28002 RepID=A0AA86PR69_9EUKA|nr:Conserved hypothetical protein [Hexamita inflata]